MNKLVKSIVEHEGFSPTAYPDVLTGSAPYTFGHGLTSITEDESIMILKNRISSISAQLSLKLSYFSSLPDDAKEVLIEMAYQMGVNGLLQFKNTLKMVSQGDYIGASRNMMLSLWAKQTPKRALDLSRKMAYCLHK